MFLKARGILDDDDFYDKARRKKNTQRHLNEIEDYDEIQEIQRQRIHG